MGSLEYRLNKQQNLVANINTFIIELIAKEMALRYSLITPFDAIVYGADTKSLDIQCRSPKVGMLVFNSYLDPKPILEDPDQQRVKKDYLDSFVCSRHE